VNLSDLRRALPHPGRDGLSMADLQSAASIFGVGLRETRIRREDFPLDRPVIALLSTEDDGHFVVLQPVGTTGTMAMVCDFPRPPRIVDYASLSDSEGWNGLALVPVRPWESAFPYSVGITTSVFVTFLSYVLHAMRRGRTPTRT
jgi:ABC-type bacteriocin/lantibiotic exporter with double-glycine peptidase domain